MSKAKKQIEMTKKQADVIVKRINYLEGCTPQTFCSLCDVVYGACETSCPVEVYFGKSCLALRNRYSDKEQIAMALELLDAGGYDAVPDP